MEVYSGFSARSIQCELRGCSRHWQGLGQNGNSIALSLPASTRAISISELRRDIFQLVDLDQAARKKTLLALALTCASFTGMALDLLWQRLENFTPLIRCLPPSLWRLDNHELKFQRAMISKDWSIFCNYNHRVRSLVVTSGYLISNEIWAMITCPPFSSPLLPNLTSLTWLSPRGTEFSSIRLFVTQKLTTLDIHPPYGVNSDLSTQSILSSISMLCPSVSHFRFDSHMRPLDTSIALQSWLHLSSVKTGRISDAAILHLANLPSLQELHFELDLPTISEGTATILQHPVFLAFPVLQELSVACRSLASLDAIFKAVSIDPKRLFFTIYVGVDSIHALPASMSCISNACVHSALEHLRVHVLEHGYSGTSFSAAVIQPFCAFRNLRKFDFCTDYDMDLDLDGTTFLQMVKAWPLLEELTIHIKSYMNEHYITANSFVALLQQCPRLTSVVISVDWSGVDQRDVSLEIPYQGFIHESLSCANFCSSRIHYATGVAAFLSAITPKLKTISAWGCSHHCDTPFEEYLPRWKAVRKLVKSFSAIRERERRMIVKGGGIGGGGIKVGGEDPEKDSEMENDMIHSDDIFLGSEDEE